jgi:hypothetical protein
MFEMSANNTSSFFFLKKEGRKYLRKPSTYITSVVQQLYGYNVTGQLQEPKDLIRPATAKIVFTILWSPEASLLQA